jgi:glucose/arabinose dehydrogenase
MRIFARGLRNPNGMDWAPGTSTLWTVVNERDMLGDDVPPDYLTSVRDGAFYGWPYAYLGRNEDPRHKGKRPDLVARAFVGQRGSWNRSAFAGYKVLFVRFKDGRPAGLARTSSPASSPTSTPPRFTVARWASRWGGTARCW